MTNGLSPIILPNIILPNIILPGTEVTGLVKTECDHTAGGTAGIFHE